MFSNWTRESREDSLYSQLLNPSHSAFLIKFSTVVGVPTLVREYSKCYQNSQRFAVTGISSTCHVRIQNFRLRTLGVPVSNSDSREASRNLLTPRSSKLELRFFLHHDVCVWQLKHVLWDSNVISGILRTFSKFP